MTRCIRLTLSVLLLLALHTSAPGQTVPSKLIEPPALSEALKSGRLPPMRDRIPEEPMLADLKAQQKSFGRYGGELRLLMGKQKDTRLVVIYGYARLVCYRPDFQIHPDILRKVDVEADRVFTFHLRKGHRWSDGHAFTSEDFRYYWEDIANNPVLSPSGPAAALRVGGEMPKFEILGPQTVRYTWSRPNKTFLHWLSGAHMAAIYRPAHYLRQFHPRYGDKAKIAALVKSEGRRNWAALHKARDSYARAQNPDRPTLQPWMNTTPAPANRFVFKRNPYYHRIDAQGRQLPYIDRVVISLGSVDVIPARTGAGESDLQARYIRFDNYTFLKKAAKRNNLRVLLWRNLKSAHTALIPNLNANDKAWRTLMRDVRFRRALSLSVNRHEINQVIYFGLAKPSAATVMPQSPLYKPELRTAWTSFDLKTANRLLDEIGLIRRNDEGVRLLPDGRPMEILIDTAGESTEQTDILELIKDSWRKIGIKLFSRPARREIFRQRVLSGQSIMSMWPITANALAHPGMSPQDFAPTSKMQYQWPKWGRHFQSGGKSGEAPDIEPAKQLLALYKQWQSSSDAGEQERIWRRILEIHADQVFVIGIVNGTLRPVVVANRLHNIPKHGVYHWDPGAYFGIYKPDTFWYGPPIHDHPSMAGRSKPIGKPGVRR